MSETQFAVLFLVAMTALAGLGVFFAEGTAEPYKGRANMRSHDTLIIAAIAGLALGVTWAVLG